MIYKRYKPEEHVQVLYGFHITTVQETSSCYTKGSYEDTQNDEEPQQIYQHGRHHLEVQTQLYVKR